MKWEHVERMWIMKWKNERLPLIARLCVVCGKSVKAIRNNSHIFISVYTRLYHVDSHPVKSFYTGIKSSEKKPPRTTQYKIKKPFPPIHLYRYKKFGAIPPIHFYTVVLTDVTTPISATVNSIKSAQFSTSYFIKSFSQNQKKAS